MRKMKIQEMKLSGAFEITPTLHVDSRGFLARTYDQDTFKNEKIDRRWVQESWSHTENKFTVRGLHVQFSPYTETKLVSIINGKMMWVIVDVRKGSDTFGKWDSVLLSSEERNSLFVERGFAHGCLSLTDNCDLLLKSDCEFIEGKGTGILWNDPIIGINWGETHKTPIISERDQSYQSFDKFVMKYSGI